MWGYDEGIKRVFVYYNSFEDKLAISFRGTEGNLADWSENFEIAKTLSKPDGKNIGSIHSGFLDEYLTYRASLLNFVTNFIENNHTKIIVTGHSQGGALASICAVDLGYVLSVPKHRMKLITFGAPAAGDSFFKSLGNTYVDASRVALGSNCYYFNCIIVDYVTGSLPETFGYYHYGKLIPLWDASGPCHSLDYYIPNVLIKVPYNERSRVLIKTTIWDSNYGYLDLEDIPPYSTVSIYLRSYYSPIHLLLKTISSPNSTEENITITLPTSIDYDISYYMEAKVNTPLTSNYFTIESDIFKVTSLKTCPSTCKECYGNGTCKGCINGVFGELCNNPCLPSCETCSNSSTCASCQLGFIGSTCTVPVCSQGCKNGECVAPNFCSCYQGWRGSNCSEAECPPGCLTCSNYLQCTACKDGFYGVTCNYQCLPTCQTCSGPSSCTKCPTGFSGPTCETKSTSTTLYFYGSNTDLFSATSYASRSSYSLPSKADKVFMSSNAAGVYIISDDGTFYMGSQSPLSQSKFTKTNLPNDIIDMSYFQTSILYITKNNNGTVRTQGSVPGLPAAGQFNTGIGKNLKKVKLLQYYSFYLTDTGELYVYAKDTTNGCPISGIYMVSSNTSLLEIKFPNQEKIKTFDCYSFYCYAISTTNKLYGWGNINYYYYLSTALCDFEPIELLASFSSNVTKIVANYYSTFYLTDTGDLYKSGRTSYGFSPAFPQARKISEVFFDNYAVLDINALSDANFASVTTSKLNSYVFGKDNMFSSLTASSTTDLISNTLKVDSSGSLVFSYIIFSQTTCNGKLHFDPNVCSGRGTCTDTNVCKCKDGYGGKNCELYNCFDFDSTDSRTCSGKGNCVGPNVCTCYSPFKGNNCQDFNCTSNCAACSNPFQCSSCISGRYNLNQLCTLRCGINCEKCDENGGCLECKSGFKGTKCETYSCVDNCNECVGPNTCGLCNENFGSQCENSCPFRCTSCASNTTCLSCESGWLGQLCDTPICDSNCLTCSSPGKCSKCLDGYFGENCQFTCPEKCKSCSNSTSCNQCANGFGGLDCNERIETCTTSINDQYPLVTVSRGNTGQLNYTVTISKEYFKGNYSMRLSLSEITNCSINLNDIQYKIIESSKCSLVLQFLLDIPTLLTIPTINKQLDENGLIYTLTFPIYVAFQFTADSNLGKCNLINYPAKSEIKVILNANQYIGTSVGKTDLLKFRQELLTIRNNLLHIEGTLLLNGTLLSIKNLPSNSINFTINYNDISNGEYYLTLTASKQLEIYNGEFIFEITFKSNENICITTFSISINYVLPVGTPPITLEIMTALYIYNEGFTTFKNSFETNQRPNILVKLIPSTSNSMTDVPLPSSMELTIYNAYLCCVTNEQSVMPTFNLEQGKYGCTKRDNSIMTVWYQLILNGTMNSLSAQLVKFPLINNMIGFSFRLSELQSTLTQKNNNCYIHSESKLKNAVKRRKVSNSEDNSFHSFNILQITKSDSVVAYSSGERINSGNRNIVTAMTDLLSLLFISLLLLLLQ
ncbi:hypothetical protein ABK040_000269 [Willaertia magna]